MIKYELKKDAIILKIEKITDINVIQFEKFVHHILEINIPKKLVFDLTNATHIDSSGIALLYKIISDKFKEIKIFFLNPSEFIEKKFEEIELLDYSKIITNIKEIN